VNLQSTIKHQTWPGLVIIFLLLSSCDEVGRRKALTLFFDGVPPLRREVSETESSVQKNDKAPASAPVGNWHIHEPVKDCTACHGNQPRRGTSGKVQLVAQVPQLCYKCHKEHEASEGWVHGPVATGDCLLCHEPHKTRTESLLRKPVPELCYQCHEPEAIRAIEGHVEPSHGHCVDCHEGHAGATKSLLKPVFLDTPAGRQYKSDVYRRKYESSLKKARYDVAQGLDFYTVCRTIVDCIEGDQWWPARAYLEVLLDSSLITDAEKPEVAEVLQQVIAVQTSESTEAPEGPEADAARKAPVATLRAMAEQRSKQEQSIAEIYFRSIQQYHAGQLVKAREGFLEVLKSGSLPQPLRDTAQSYVEKIDQALRKSS
jgi:predicted CXXCH cytochrome family protein